MHIGNVAERSGVPAKTIRYYESIGLIPSAARTTNGYRIYDELDLRTLQFIQRARRLGFSVSEVASLLALWRDRSRASAEVKQLAQTRIAHVERKIEELQMIKGALLDLADRCQGDDRPECPIIDELAGDPDGRTARTSERGQGFRFGGVARKDTARNLRAPR